jgi:Cohesin domain
MTLWEASVLIRRSVVSIVFVWAMSAASASATPILSIDPTSTTVNVGDSVVLEIKIGNVIDLFAFSFDLLFDQTILSFQSITEGAFLTSGGDPTFFIPGSVFPPDSGTVSGTGNVVIGAGVSGSGTLAIATFLAQMDGTSSISFQELVFVDSNSALIAVDAVNSGSVEVIGVPSAVPDEPSAMILLASALALAACRSFTRAS